MIGALLSAGCTVVLRDPGVSNGCGPLRYSFNTHDITLTPERRAAVDDAIAEFGALVGRSVEPSASGGATAESNRPGDPIAFELAWPEDDPDGLGYAEPHIVGDSYAGGWVMLNPIIRHAPPGLIRRLVLHELGHLHGLADVEDGQELMDPSLVAEMWGPGDLLGLVITHNGGC